MKLRDYSRATLLSIAVGILAGLAATVFLLALDWATSFREIHFYLLLGLPVAGYFTSWLYLKYGERVQRGNNLVIDEIHEPENTLPLRMAPMILGSTILTHLFGGSAGREGTAVQMAASLADQVAKIFKVSPQERRRLLTAGAGAGFGAAIGTPWAGAVFGLEVLNIGRLDRFAWYESVVASFVGYYLTMLLRAPHSNFKNLQLPDANLENLSWLLLAGVCFGLAAKVFSWSSHWFEKAMRNLFPYAPMKSFVGGMIVVTAYFWEGSFRYVGLGIPFIQQGLTELASWRDPFFKSILTTITVGSGFKGGEFIPLVFIGTTLGSALAAIIPVSVSLLAGVGFAAVFAGAANTPIACALMATEIFGLRIAPFAFIACFASYYTSGSSGIYKSQKLILSKDQRLKIVIHRLKKIFVDIATGLKKRFD